MLKQTRKLFKATGFSYFQLCSIVAKQRELYYLNEYTGEKEGYLKKKKLQTDSNVYQDRWFVVKDGKLSYFRDCRVRALLCVFKKKEIVNQ